MDIMIEILLSFEFDSFCTDWHVQEYVHGVCLNSSNEIVMHLMYACSDVGCTFVCIIRMFFDSFLWIDWIEKDDDDDDDDDCDDGECMTLAFHNVYNGVILWLWHAAVAK